MKHMTKTEAEAYNAGFERGRDAGSWILDGNSTEETARRILAGINDCDPAVMDLQPSPLSGEWAGESIPELSAEYGLDLEDEGVADRFEQGFTEGFWDEVTETAQTIIGER